MFDIGYSELLLVAIVALLVVGPKELPTLMRTVGRWVGQARSVARQFRAGFDEMVREAEIAEMNRKWEAQNAEIMATTSGIAYKPADPDATDDAAVVAGAEAHQPPGAAFAPIPAPDAAAEPGAGPATGPANEPSPGLPAPGDAQPLAGQQQPSGEPSEPASAAKP